VAIALATYRRALQARLDDGGVYLASSGTGSTVVIGAITDATTNASTTRYNGAWVYLASGAGIGTQRRVVAGGFTPSTGTLSVELGWAAPALGDLIEITHLFPSAGGPAISVSPEDTSYLQFINKSLSRVLAPDRISVAFAGASSASTATWPWLDRPERLVRVLEPAPVSGYPVVPCDWRNPRLILDGPTPVLQLDQVFTGTLTLEVLRPGDTLISGVESTTGFTTEGQTALPSVNDVVEVALEEAYIALSHRSPGRPNGSWAAKLETQRGIVANLKYLDRTQMAQEAA
jgi:hypothetical protein